MNISLIIPYSGKKAHLEKCVWSILPQMEPKDEIIIVDDSIKGLTGTITSFVTAVIPNEEFDRKSNNLVYCRNLGAKSATNDILVFVDEDIFACNNFLDTYRRLVPEYEIVCGKIEWQSKGTIKQDYRIDTDAEIVKFNNLAKRGNGGGGNFAVLRRLFDAVGGFSMEYNGMWGAEDIDLFRKIQALNKDIYYSPLASVIHMEHDRNLIGNMLNHAIFKDKWEC